MHIEVGDHALIDEFGLHEVAGEFDALRLRHLARKGEFHLAGELCVLPDLERLDIVPKPFAVAPRLRRSLRQHDLGMDDAALVGEVVAALKPVVAQPRGRAVGGGSHRAGAGLAADDLDVKMIDRHRDRIITTAKRTSERRISAPSLKQFLGTDHAVPACPGNLTAFRQALNYHFSIDSLWRTMMRKPRDFDAELKSLEDKARDLRKPQGATAWRTGHLDRSRRPQRRRTGGRADRAGRNQGCRKEGGMGEARRRVLSGPVAANCIGA